MAAEVKKEIELEVSFWPLTHASRT